LRGGGDERIATEGALVELAEHTGWR
jgi:hypothetical protein